MDEIGGTLQVAGVWRLGRRLHLHLRGKTYSYAWPLMQIRIAGKWAWPGLQGTQART